MAPDIYEDTLYGQVLPLDWNDDAISGVMLLVDGEDEFIVEPDKNGKRLYDYIDHWMTVEGIVKETARELRIKVRKFTLEDEMDYSDDDNW